MKNWNLMLGALLLTGLVAGGAELQRVTFREVDTLFANPGIGWMSGHRSPKTAPHLAGSSKLWKTSRQLFPSFGTDDEMK
jgi:hypothetical protein